MPPAVRSALISDGTGRRGSVDRAEYLIDRFRVSYAFGGGWKCGCAEFASRDSCKHTREAAGRRAAQSRIAEHVSGGSVQAFSMNEPVTSRATQKQVQHHLPSARRQMR
jgi:hypothetical protein